jgi:hypothetical protein
LYRPFFAFLHRPVAGRAALDDKLNDAFRPAAPHIEQGEDGRQILEAGGSDSF